MKTPIKKSAVDADKRQVVLWQEHLDFGVDTMWDGHVDRSDNFGADKPGLAESYYYGQCSLLKLDPEPETSKLQNLWRALEAVGWVHVNTWEESHGEYSDFLFECPACCIGAPVQQLSITGHRRHGEPVELRINISPRGSHLLARDIRANETGGWQPLGPKRVSSCCTADYQDFQNKHSGARFRIEDVVGHGAVAWEITPEDKPA